MADNSAKDETYTCNVPEEEKTIKEDFDAWFDMWFEHNTKESRLSWSLNDPQKIR